MKKEAREGYKMTELGEIPNEWTIDFIKNITIEHKQGYYSKSEYDNCGTYLMRITDLRNHKIDFSEMPKIRVSKEVYQQYKLELGDFLFARSGTIGRYGIYNKEIYPKAIFASYIIKFKFNENLINNSYLGYFYESSYCTNQLKAITQGSSNININANNIKSLKICLPNLKEQEKIAEILSTVDEQIENTEKLIQKNEDLKKGLMQQLLTKGIGHTEFKKTELGDIPKEWEVKRFKDISKVSQGLQIAIEERFREFKQGRLPYITIQYINDKSNSDNEYFIENYNENVVCYESDILMTRTGNTGIVITNEYGVFHNNFFKVDFDRTKLNKDFLVYYLNTPFIQNLIIRYAGTTTIPDLKHNDFYKLPVLVPKIEEQKKIALILSAMDENIAKYKDKKEKLKILKNGLMQKLLSGEIRNLNFGEN
ncbi:restriction endonuclease subunit S [Clostridium perfringens]|nr:restriction endonuclease subunit S [Clostridium perfringens]HAT4183708.1 hypothetical protein [Clostridium perfringens]